MRSFNQGSVLAIIHFLGSMSYRAIGVLGKTKEIYVASMSASIVVYLGIYTQKRDTTPNSSAEHPPHISRNSFVILHATSPSSGSMKIVIQFPSARGHMSISTFFTRLRSGIPNGGSGIPFGGAGRSSMGSFGPGLVLAAGVVVVVVVYPPRSMVEDLSLKESPGDELVVSGVLV